MEKVSQLRGGYFQWDEEYDGRQTAGFIAEEVGEVLPKKVLYEGNGLDTLGMDYTKVSPLLFEVTRGP